MKQEFLKSNTKGFTLIELMIVVAIIGILAAIAIPQFKAYRERAYLASMEADCNSLRIAEEAYYVDNGAYYYGTDETQLKDYGLTNLSKENTFVAAAVTSNSTEDFSITINSSKYTTKQVVFDSTTGLTDVKAK